MGKVLIYILAEGKGGVEEYAMNLSRFCNNASSKYGYLVMGEKTVYEEELKELGVDYYYIPRKKKIISNIKAYQELLMRLRTEYDTMYSNTSGLYYPVPYLYAIKYNYKLILHSHLTSGPLYKRPLHYFNRWWINKYCNTRLACSTPAGEWMFGKKNRFDVIPNAIDLERFRFDEKNRELCRCQYGLESSFVIGNIGRLHQVKNQVFLVKILRALVCKRIKAKLLLVGDGEMKHVIENYARKLEVNDNIVFVGQTDKPEYFYSAMDCFAMPSFVEGFPITLVEAQANGLSCVVSDVVTKETNITGHVFFANLREGADAWADLIVKSAERYEGILKLKRCGYDVRTIENGVWKIISERKAGQ